MSSRELKYDSLVLVLASKVSQGELPQLKLRIKAAPKSLEFTKQTEAIRSGLTRSIATHNRAMASLGEPAIPAGVSTNSLDDIVTIRLVPKRNTATFELLD